MKINVNDTEALEDALASFQAGARARTITAQDIQRIAGQLDSQLADRLYQKDWKGLQFQVDLHAEPIKGPQRSTKFRLVRGQRAWFVTALYRSPCWESKAKIKPLNIKRYAEQLAAYAAGDGFSLHYAT